MRLSGIEQTIDSFAKGEMIIVVDDHDRENEGDIVVASDSISARTVAFMMNHARGLICVAMDGDRLDELDIPLMVPSNTEVHTTAFTVSVDVIDGTSTGISAADRAATVRALADRKFCAQDFARPGHIFPLRAHPAGLSARRGHTEAAIALAKLAGKFPSAVICEIANDDGTMARMPELLRFAATHNLNVVSIQDLVDFIDKMAPTKMRNCA